MAMVSVRSLTSTSICGPPVGFVIFATWMSWYVVKSRVAGVLKNVEDEDDGDTTDVKLVWTEKEKQKRNKNEFDLDSGY